MTESTKKRLLVVDDEENMRHMLGRMLEKCGYRVDVAENGEAALEMMFEAGISPGPYDFVLCDIKMPVMDGLKFLKASEGAREGTAVIMMSAYGSIDTAVEAMKLGAYDYVSKPFKLDEIKIVLENAGEREALRRENRLLKRRINHIAGESRFGSMIGSGPSMKNVFSLATRASLYDTTVLVTGESGTGKELVARGIHFEGKRADGPFLAVNCGGIPESLIESELFGYGKGAFTGAERDKKGLFEEACGGTLFLDEIGELPMKLQVSLLRVLQESEIRRVGDTRTRKIDVRIVTATSRNLEEEVERGSFRQDLYYRLNVLTISLPPLRQRVEDIPELCRCFMEKAGEKHGRRIENITPEAMGSLVKHSWPGNVRELENIIERAVILSDGNTLNAEHFPDPSGPGEESSPGAEHTGKTGDAGLSLKVARKHLEKEMIGKALEATGGNRTQAAKLLEISHPSLLNKIKLYNLK